MNEENKNSGLFPRLRFPEFRDADGWKIRSIPQIATLHKGKGISKSDIVANGVKPCIRYGELYTSYGEVIDEVISRTNLPNSDLFLSKKNDVIVPASGETKIDIATAACVIHANIALGSDLNIIRSTENGIFLSYYLNGPLKSGIAKIAQGDAVVHLYPSQLERLGLAIPLGEEQQKIADCLSSLDALISAETQKLDAIKTHKKGLMQKLFPREGDTVPQLRFPEFRDAGNWQMRKVSALITRLVSPVDVDADATYKEIGIRSHGKGIFHKEPVIGKSLGEKRVFEVEEDAFVVNIVFAWEQAVAVTSAAEKGMIASHRFPMYKAIRNKADVDFIKYFFLTKRGKELLGIASPGGAGRNKTLGQKEFGNLDLLSPTNVAEQTKIAKLLISVDELIGVQSQKIDSLRDHKKGLMQQLFPAMDEVQQ